MLTELAMILIATAAVTSGIAYKDLWTEEVCNCGYGGLCGKASQLHILNQVSCRKICPEVSKGFYEGDCSTIVNHCFSSPCGANGTCIQSFGGYFCICHRDHFGKNCEIHDPTLTELDYHPSLYVYYQVQTLHHRKNLFHVVFDPFLNDLESSNLEVQVVVNISDGRSYYPRGSEHFKPVDVKSACLAEAANHPIDRDERVCGFIPSGTLSTFKFDPAYYGSMSQSDVVTIDGFGVVGGKGSVTVFVFLIDKTSKSILKTLYNHTYHTFTYRRLRIPNHCLIEITFSSCSSDHRFPFVHARGSRVVLSVIKHHLRCNGSLYVGYAWNLQKHTDIIEPTLAKDFMPVTLTNYEGDSDKLIFRPRFFNSGVHMIEYKLLIRGRPPHYGGTDQFHTYGRCWIHVITHPPIVRVKGGNMQSVSCYGPMNLVLENISKDININYIQFEAFCNDTKDPECDKIVLRSNNNMIRLSYKEYAVAPAVQKHNTACNTYLKYTVHSRNTELDPLFIYLHFINYPSSMKIECISNCFPINPKKRSLLIATTDRYVPSEVTWNVTRDGVTITERDGEINAFAPSTATRIIRMNGERFCDPNAESSKVHFLTRGPHNMHAGVTTICINLKINVDDFELNTLADGITHTFTPSSPKYYNFTYPVVYRIFLREPELLADIQIFESNYQDRLIFTPFWPEAQLCVYDAYGIVACSRWRKVYRMVKQNITFEELDAIFYIKDYRELMKKVFVHLVFNNVNVIVDGHKAMSWLIPPSKRLALLELIERIPSFKQHSDQVFALQIAVSQFLSDEGSKAERLHRIADEDFLIDVAATISHLQLRHSALTLLERVIHARYLLTIEMPEIPFGPYEFGDLRTLMHFTLSLAYIQDGYIRNFIGDVNQTVARRVQTGLVAFWIWKNNIAYISASKWYIDLLAESSKLFGGIGVYGRYFSRAWVVRTTYKGIIKALTRNSAVDNYYGCAGYIFETRNKTGLEWLDLIDVDFPPSTVDWEYKEIILIVIAVKNRQNDTSVSPTLLLSMRTKWGNEILYLPDEQSFNITLPRMWGGVIEPSRNQYVSFVISMWRDRAKNMRTRKRRMTAFKIELPVEFDVWTVVVQVDRIIPLKFMISSVIPDPIILARRPDVYPSFDMSRGKFVADIKLTPETGKNFVPRYFYLGISPSFEIAPWPQITITLQRTTDVCFVDHSSFARTVSPIGRSICKGLNRDLDTIQCNCNQLGLFQAYRYPITIRKLLLGEIPFILPIRTFAYENIVITAALICLFAAMLFFAIRKDQANEKQQTLIYVEDNYPSDDCLMVIGVTTGLYSQGGTSSKVGIMLVGENSSSRVHLLESPTRRTLATGHDDWFVIALPHPPGKITRINLWRDYSSLSGWFCDRITIYDLSENKFYVAIVEKWIELKITEETPRLEVVEVKQLDHTDDRLQSHTFPKNYVREFRNTHDLISINTMHPRCLLTREVRSHILIVKWCCLYFWIWFTQVVHYHIIPGRYFGADFTGNLFNLGIEAFVGAFWVALISHPITFAIDYYYRSETLSRVIQKKTTNPLYQASFMEKRRASELSFRTSTKGKMSAAGKSRPSKTSIHKQSRAVFKYATSNVSGVRKGGIRLAVGPTQFRCVDVRSETIALKMKKAVIIVRLASCVTLLGFVGLMMYVQFHTPFTWKWEICLSVFARAIVLDVFLLAPLLICLKSAIAFYVYHINNKERFPMSEDLKVHQPLRTKYENYLMLATRKECKLPLSADIEVAKKRKLITVIAKRTVFYLIALLGMYCTCEILMDKYGLQHFNLMRTLKDSMTSARARHGLESIDPQEVYDIKSAALYVSNTVAALTGIWPNGNKVESTSFRGTNVRWTYDHFGQGRGSSSVLLLYIDDDSAPRTTPIEFEEYFINGTGYYSESTPEKDPLLIGDTALNFTILSNNDIRGESMEVYPFAGHLKLIPLKPWEDYYSQMRILMSDAIDKQAEHYCRALIISTNYVYPFVQYLGTIDVLIEFLPSGISRVNIQARGIKTGAPSHYRMIILRVIIAATLICFATYTVAIISKIGPKKYFSDSNNISKFLICLANLATIVCFLLRYPLKYGAIETINTTTEEYSDLHPIYKYEVVDSLFLALFFLAILLDFLLIIPKLIGTVWLNEFCICSIRVALLIVLLQLYLTLSVAVASQVHSRSFASYFILAHTFQPPKHIHQYHQVECILFYLNAVVVVILGKFVVAFMITIAHLVKEGRTFALKTYLNILRRKPLQIDPENRGGIPIATFFHGDPRKLSSTKSTDDLRSNALTVMSGRLSSKHRIFV